MVSLLLAFTAAPVLGHAVFVDPPGKAEGKAQWLGGPTDSEGRPVGLPGKGKALLDSPIGKLSPSHAKGQVRACHATASSKAVRITAPPYFTGCVHGLP